MITTDPQDELFPLVSENNTVIGTISRKHAHASPNQIHRAIYVIVKNKKDEWLIQKRSQTKDTFPGVFDLSVGGHVNSDDTYLETAIRELSEELGILAKNSELAFIGETLVILPWEKEFFYVFEYTIKSVDNIRLNSLEINDTSYMTIKDIKESLRENHRWSGKVRQIIDAFYS